MTQWIFQTFSIWIFQTVAMALTALLIPRLTITSIFGAIGCVAALALVNATLWDVALFFSIPDNLGTHTLLLIAANGLIFWAIVKLLPGIEVSGFLPALAAPLLFTVLSLVITHYGRQVDWPAAINYLVGEAKQTKEFFLEQQNNADRPAEARPEKTPRPIED